ncbi:MAG: RNA polymerase sigma-70 factor [Bacteroidales bacterium]|nr:RNA polymerase sigma-70 factor [Bacteroidales bacterium]
MSPNSDIELFRRIGRGDRYAFDSLFRKWYPSLVAFAEGFLEREEAENAVQDVMMRLWSGAAGIELRSSVSSYLFTAVRNRCLNAMERREIQQKYISAVRLSIMEAVAPTDLHSMKEINIHLQSSLRELPPEQREAFELSRFEGLKYEEIAARTGVSVKTVEYRISQALKTLRAALSDWLK